MKGAARRSPAAPFLLPGSVAGNGVGTAVLAPAGEGGFGVFDELAVSGIVPDAGNQDGGAGGDAERGGGVVVGGCGGVSPHCAGGAGAPGPPGVGPGLPRGVV